jgi:extracellular elastinolytic metalloproteinase
VAKNGSVFSYGSSFYSGAIPAPQNLAKRSSNEPVNALNGVNGVLGLSIYSEGATVESKGSEKYIIKGTQGANQDPKAQLVYIQTPKNELVLTWRVETDLKNNWFVSYANAGNTKDIVGVVDYTSHAGYEV